jgi:acyl-CoA thioesterase YciA
MRDRGEQPNSTQPKGELASRTQAMPADSNPKGDIFGGWIMSLMDLAGKMSAIWQSTLGTRFGGQLVTQAVRKLARSICS